MYLKHTFSVYPEIIPILPNLTSVQLPAITRKELPAVTDEIYLNKPPNFK